MSITASTLIALVEARGAKEAAGQLLEVGAASEEAGGKLKTMALGGLAIAGASLIGLGIESVKSAADFQTAMLSDVAHAGLAKSQFDSVSKSVESMASAVGRSPDQLAEALYPILSAFSGIQNQSAKSAIALDTLKDSFQAVAGTTTDGTAVANAAVGAFNALGLATNNVSENTKRMTNLFDVMDKTTQLGNMQWETYKNVVSKLAVAIQGTSITFNESQAALAEMTNEGFTAQKASTYLANTFTTLAIKTDTLAKHAKSMGLAFNEQKYSSMDLAGKIEYLNQVTDGNKQKLLALMGNNSTALKTFNALSTGIEGYKNNVEALNHAHGALAYSFDEASKGMNFEVDQLKAAGQAFMVSIGTQILPVASEVLKVITPLVGRMTDWVNSLSQLGDAFQSVTQPIKKTQDALAPLTDTFDRATAIIHQTHQATQPMLDTFDRATAILHQTHQAAAPLLDTFDRATAIIPKTTAVVKKTTEAVSPLVAIFKYWKPVLTDTVVAVEKLAGDVETFATGIAGAADKSGAFQSALQFIHDILPDVDTFLVRAGSAIDSDLLPPLESLITNVGYVVRDFTDWLDKSGTAKSAIADLGTAVGITAQVVGTLVTGLADIIGWFDQDAPQAYILAGAVTAVGLAFAGLKVANTIAGFQQMFAQFTDGESIISKLASTFKGKFSSAVDDFTTRQFPNLKKAMDDSKTSAADMGTAAVEAEAEVTQEAEVSSAKYAELTANMNTLSQMTAENAAAAAAEEEKIGTTAETVAGEVEAGSVSSAAALDEITVAAEEATVAEETVGTTAETKMAGGVEAGASSSKSAMGGLGGMIGGLIIGIGILGNQLAWGATKGKDFVSQFQQGDWLGSIEHFIALGTPGGQLASTIDTFTKIAQQMGLVKSSAADMDKKVVASMTDMQKQSIAQGAQLSTGLQNLFNTLSQNADGTFGQMSDDAYGYLQNVENYVNQAQEKALAHQIGRGATNIIGKNAYASGTDYAPGGPSLVGERGAELVLGPTFGNLPQGSRVIPHAQTEALLGGLGGGGGNQPIHVHVHIADHEFEYLTNAIMGTAARQTRLRHGRRSY